MFVCMVFFFFLQILPVVEKVYPFEALPEAYAHVNSGSKMGKIVVDFPQTWGIFVMTNGFILR